MPKKNKRKRNKTPLLSTPEGDTIVPARNPTLERLAVDWIDLKEKMEAVKEETKTAAESLASQMRVSNTPVYQWDGHRIELTPGKDKITLKDIDGAGVEE
jgi:hypothetical protein